MISSSWHSLSIVPSLSLFEDTVKRRPDLKLIVTSATLEAEKFSNYFFDCPIFTIPGRMYPVETMYSRDPTTDYLDAALMTVMEIHFKEPPGDILVFLTGQEGAGLEVKEAFCSSQVCC